MPTLWDYEKRKKIRENHIYKNTNKVWNKYRLNKRENIGSTMNIIKICKPKNLEEWENFYEKSGKEADEMKSHLSFKSFKELKEAISEINREHGKTKDNLTDLAKEFQGYLKNEGMDLDLDTCFNYVYIRAVDETFLGYQREMIAFKILTDYCQSKGFTIKETSDFDDVYYGVDFEIFKNDKLLAGVQAKGSVYKRAVNKTSSSNVIKKADQILQRINSEYSTLKKVPVFYVYVEEDLTIKDTSIFNQIDSLSKSKCKTDRIDR
ncbi:MAG: MjaI family restriction endonuclease [Lachnospiraceae bacterium]|nr:MjaI family restriction endonuclease [Lachnospiraceae bacterium]